MALSLDARLNAFNCTTQLQEVKKTLDTAQPSVTFWGARVVELAGNDGSVYLDNIAEKVVRAASKHRDANNLTTNDRRIGVEIVQKLQTFYKLTDAQIKTLNFFTRFLVWIREFSFIDYTPRFYIEQVAERDFQPHTQTT